MQARQLGPSSDLSGELPKEQREVGEEELLEVHTQEHLGWRVSYKKAEHVYSEKAAQRRRRFLSAQSRAMEPRLVKGQEPRRHGRTAEAKLEAAKAKSSRATARKRAEEAWFRTSEPEGLRS